MDKVNYTKQKTEFCLELDRVKLLLQKIGNPDRKLNIIHIAGTNGKGSVGSFLEAGFKVMGKSCGRFQSPHLFRPEDGITIDGLAITSDSLEYFINRLDPHIAEVESELGIAPSPFEILFAAVLLYFKENKCEIVILECGMGGAGDATNAIEADKIAVLTSIDIDHTGYLGTSAAEIAANKCGILRPGIKVYSAPQSPDVKEVIVNKQRELGCLLSFVKSFDIKSMDFLHAIVDIEGVRLRLGLAGVHQCINAAIASHILREEYKITIDKLAYALAHAENRARLESISDRIYFDGAHNVSGVRSLVNTINAADVKGKMIFAIGFMRDKDISACLDCLKNLDNRNFEIYTTKVHSNPRSAEGSELVRLALEKGFAAKEHDTIATAVEDAKNNGDIVFAFGSLYMYKELVQEKGGLL